MKTTNDLLKEWLLRNQFLPDGREDSKDFSRKIWAKGQTDDYGEQPAMHIVVCFEDSSVYLESYGTGGESLCIVELPIRACSESIRNLLGSLGQSLGDTRSYEG